jgi:hypothetical protein
MIDAIYSAIDQASDRFAFAPPAHLLRDVPEKADEFRFGA